ncbi:AraC family transcriptional regulator, partial [Corallococcus sp. CA047B]
MPDEKTDVVSDVLETLRFKTLLFGRFELGAPWALRLPSKVNASFYVVTRGGLRLQVEGSAQPMFLSAGDVVLLPRATAHVLDDGAINEVDLECDRRYGRSMSLRPKELSAVS